MVALSDKLLYCYEDNSLFAEKIDKANVEKSNIMEVVMATTSRPYGQIADRTGTFAGRFKSVLNPIPVLPSSFTKSFSDIGSERAQELIARNKEIVVLWSGGIDSTYVLIKLLKNNPLPGQITVYLSDNSIAENPVFYNQYIKDKLNVKFFNYYFPKEVPTIDQLFVTGDQIPQIFNYAFTAFLPNRDDPWEPFVLKNFESQEKAKWFLNTIQPWLNKAPFPIVSIFDYIWWTSFSMRWNNGRFRPFYYNKTFDKNLFDNNLVSFFRTTDFELWSMFNHDKKIMTTPQSFKYVMKSEIYEFDNNLDYFKNKTTERSNYNAIMRDPDLVENSRSLRIEQGNLPVAIDENFNFIYQQEVIANPENYKKFLQPTDNNEWYAGSKPLTRNPHWL